MRPEGGGSGEFEGGGGGRTYSLNDGGSAVDDGCGMRGPMLVML